MPVSSPWRRRLAAVALCCAAGPVIGAAEAPAPARSALDAQLFYQLLIGEMELRGGQHGTAYQVFLEAARRTRDPQLYRRAMDIALQARAGDEALAATRAWRQAHPDSADPLRLQLQILAAMNRMNEAAEPVGALLALTPADQRAGLIAALPRLFERAADKQAGARVIEQALAASLQGSPAERTAARVTIGRAWLAAGDKTKALELARLAAAQDPQATGPVLLAIELVPTTPDAEAIIEAHMARPGVRPTLRLAYVRLLTSTQRYDRAIAQLDRLTAEHPDDAPPYLTLGALQLEIRDFDRAETALRRYLALTEQAATPAAPASAAASAASSAPETAPVTAATSVPGETQEPDIDAATVAQRGRVQAWLMLAQSAEQRGDFPAAEAWLARIDDPERALDVQSRRASLMARQGRVDEAVSSLRRVPERQPGDARAKLIAEAQLLRDLGRWQEAHDALAQGALRFPDDVDLLYEQAMMAEKVGRIDDMEKLLRRVIELRPDHGHAYNALGYALADRSERLPEARDLIQRALELRPGDPYITDSLGWVEFRLGNLEQAEKWLRSAWNTRPDTEIGAHLGEVLWTLGRRDEAQAIWRQAGQRDAGNLVLRETMTRLKAIP